MESYLAGAAMPTVEAHLLLSPLPASALVLELVTSERAKWHRPVPVTSARKALASKALDSWLATTMSAWPSR